MPYIVLDTDVATQSIKNRLSGPLVAKLTGASQLTGQRLTDLRRTKTMVVTREQWRVERLEPLQPEKEVCDNDGSHERDHGTARLVIHEGKLEEFERLDRILQANRSSTTDLSA